MTSFECKLASWVKILTDLGCLAQKQIAGQFKSIGSGQMGTILLVIFGWQGLDTNGLLYTELIRIYQSSNLE